MKPLIFAGPCGVLPFEQMKQEVDFLYQFSDRCNMIIRGGAWKGQLYPDRKMVNGEWVKTEQEYVGLGDHGVQILSDIEQTYGLETCTEVMCKEHVDEARGNVSWAQVGARHMGNLPLLRYLRGWGGNVLLKRGPANTITEWIGAAEHIFYESPVEQNVFLCERGMVTHDHTDARIRWRPDLLAVPQVQKDYGYPVIVDASHSVGRRDLVLPMARAAMAAGAHGLMIEVMEVPEQSMTDAAQCVDHDMFEKIMREVL
jgi:3-deoxy-7-phosphoheptulonate synthase